MKPDGVSAAVSPAPALLLLYGPAEDFPVLAEHLQVSSGESMAWPWFRGALQWPAGGKLREGLGACRRRVAQWLCGMHGHERHLHGTAGYLTLRCAYCGHEAPGWDIGAPRVSSRLAGDPDRHRLARASQRDERSEGSAGEIVASARVRAARAAVAQERQAPGRALPPPAAAPRRERASMPERATPPPRPVPRTEEAPVSDRSMVLGTLVVGAVVGSAVGYLLFTAEGRKSLGQLEHWMDDMLHEAERLSRIAARTGQAATQLMDEWKHVQGSMPGGGSQARH